MVGELIKRGLTPILSGRNPHKLDELGSQYPDLEKRVASIDDEGALDRAVADSSAVINCAGPFLDTAKPVIEAALRNRVHYLDVAAEQRAALATFDEYSTAARDADIIILPAAAFYGGLADLLATAAAGDWTTSDEFEIGIALDSWHPTSGTRHTGARNTGPRFVFTNGKLEFLENPPPTKQWEFAAPIGIQEVVEVPLTETITISRHLRTKEIHNYINLAPLNDLKSADTPPPVINKDGRSSQTFLMEVIARKGGKERGAFASGKDIYYITAPIVAEAAEQIVSRKTDFRGVGSVGELFDANDFILKLSADLTFGITK